MTQSRFAKFLLIGEFKKHITFFSEQIVSYFLYDCLAESIYFTASELINMFLLSHLTINNFAPFTRVSLRFQFPVYYRQKLKQHFRMCILN